MDPEELYRNGVNQALAGFQLIEEQLKTYLGMHSDAVRAIVGDRLHFNFRSDDYQDAALGRLLTVFAKVCPNEQLVRDLQAVRKNRDHIAHRALLKLYGKPISSVEYTSLFDELKSQLQNLSALMERIHQEENKLLQAFPK